VIKVDLGFTTASVNDGEWQHDDPAVVALLKAAMPPFGVAAWVPDRDYAMAEEAIKTLGGKIITPRPAPEFVQGQIY